MRNTYNSNLQKWIRVPRYISNQAWFTTLYEAFPSGSLTSLYLLSKALKQAETHTLTVHGPARNTYNCSVHSLCTFYIHQGLQWGCCIPCTCRLQALNRRSVKNHPYCFIDECRIKNKRIQTPKYTLLSQYSSSQFSVWAVQCVSRKHVWW